MIKVLKIIFVYAIVSGICYSQDSGPFEAVTLKLNDKSNSKYSEYSSLKLNENPYKKLNLQNLLKSPFNVSKPGAYQKKLINSDSNNNLDKRYPVWVPIAEVVGLNLGIGAFNAYVSKSAYAKISFKTIQKNFQTGAVWDHDHFITNFFAHPYHGNLYFNSARSNGYSFWESAPFSFGGSLMWEIFMENEPPSVNDLINTTVSGYFLGEVLYRLSSLVIDEKKSGFERVYREVFAGMLNPMRAFNRILTGKVSRVTSKEAFAVQPILLEVSFGSNRVLQGQQLFTGIITGAFNLRMVYGNPFREEKRNPFDFFRIVGQFNTGAKDSTTSFIGSLSAYGILAGKTQNVKDQKILTGIFQHYDFFDNQIYKVGGISFGGGIISKFPTKINNSAIVSAVHLNFMPLGASNSEYSAFGEKEYNFSTGLNMKFETGIELDWGLMALNYNIYWFHTVIGTPSDEYIGLLKPRLEVRIIDHLNIGTQYTFYHREGYYKDYPDIHLRNNEVQFYAAYTFQNMKNLTTTLGF